MGIDRDDARRRLTELGLTAALLSHDFNNVLSVIAGCAGMLRVLPGLTPAQAKELDELAEAVGHGRLLARGALARARSGPAPAAGLDLNRHIARMEWMIRRLECGNVGVDLALGADVGCVRAQEVELEQVVLNLAVNARDAMPRGGRLRIETSSVAGSPEFPLPAAAPGGFARLAVSDTGVGLSDEEQARLFEPFYTTKPDGSGLGLYSVQRIVRQCGGHLRVRSAPGKGTAFEAFFRRTDGAPAPLPL
jgi:signal transduction histidine kinase